MLHPVGDLPAHVYWRRRVVVLVVLLAVLGGAGWLGFTLLAGRGTGTAAADTAVPEPALERVVPSLSAVATPDPPPVLETAEEPPAAAPDPVAGGPCTDEMLGLEVRAPGSAALGSKPTFEIAVANLSAVPCVRALDKGLEEIVMVDPAGNRLWGSNDCFPEAGSDLRTLAPGEVVVIPLVWSGLTSEPTCTAARGIPAPGTYLLRARLDTKVSADASITLG
ncbi:MAG TPA: MucR family transcriptional regulator [Blastococcus sp.]